MIRLSQGLEKVRRQRITGKQRAGSHKIEELLSGLLAGSNAESCVVLVTISVHLLALTVTLHVLLGFGLHDLTLSAASLLLVRSRWPCGHHEGLLGMRGLAKVRMLQRLVRCDTFVGIVGEEGAHEVQAGVGETTRKELGAIGFLAS